MRTAPVAVEMVLVWIQHQRGLWLTSKSVEGVCDRRLHQSRHAATHDELGRRDPPTPAYITTVH